MDRHFSVMQTKCILFKLLGAQVIEQIESIIKAVVSEMNEDREAKFDINDNPTFIGSSSVFDSMDLVTMLSEVEEKLSDELNLDITIASEKAFSRKASPFYNIKSLSSFIVELTEEK